MRFVSAVLVCLTSILLSPAQGQEYASLAREKEGRFPIHIPSYDGVDQLLLLSSRWVIVVTVDLEEVARKIDELSGGVYLKTIDTWEQSEKAGKPNWTAYRERFRIRDQFIAQAREMVGERKLDSAEFYSIASPDDPVYADARHPKRVTRFLVSLGGQRVRGGHEIHYAHYCYLELPQALRNGCTYAIALGNGKKVIFLYDEMRTISRAIKVNQLGYLPDAPHKYAYLGAYLHELGPLDFSDAKRFQVISVDTGRIVYSGDVRLRETNPRFAPRPDKGDDPNSRPLICGEDVYEMDFSGLREEGEFFITIPGVGRSWTFRHARDVYGEAFYTVCRALYHQRCGIALEQPYTRWTRIKCHTDPIYECDHIPFGIGNFNRPKDYQVFDVIGASVDASRKTENVVGGWHDAADWDRNIHHYACIFDLLNAYEMAPGKFGDGQLDIPESGNGIPDILDEAEFGLLVWKRSMDERGAVSGMVETWTHPRIDDPTVKYAFSRRTRWSSLVYAAAAAQYAHLVRPFSKDKAEEYAASAQRAYQFGNDPRNSLGHVVIHAARDRGRGEKYTYEWDETGEMNWPYLIQAKLRLYILSRERAYLEGLPDLAGRVPPPFRWPFRYCDFSGWLYYDIASGAREALPQDLVQAWTKTYVTEAQDLAQLNEQQPYRQSWPRHQDYWMAWGASCMTNQARVLLMAHHITRDVRFRDAAILNADFMLGANPMGMCWTTGLGWVYPIDIQHANSENDGILDPVPGITIYGVTGGVYPDLKAKVWRSPKPDGGEVDFMAPANWDVPVLRRWFCHPHLNVPQNEFTIHETVASTIFTFAMLMPDGWMPNPALKNKLPRRDDLLFGYWYLP